MKECISHHAACDCREQAYKDKIEELETALDSARAIYEMAQEASYERELQAEIRGAAWVCDWYATKGVRSFNVDPSAICEEARKKSGI